MTTRRILASALLLALLGGTAANTVRAAAQQMAAISGTAKDEAKKPFEENTVRARDIQLGQIAGTVGLDSSGEFALSGLAPAKYLIELVNRKGKVVCTEGPFDVSEQSALVKSDVVIDCNKKAAWWLLGAAGAAGITAGVVSGGQASASQ